MHSVIQTIIKNSPHLSWMEDGLLFLARHGSWAYGLNTETSDEDFKGFCCPPKSYFFSATQKFHQAELKAP